MNREKPYRTAQQLIRERKYAEALVVYEQLAREGDVHCQVYVGWMYHDGVGTRRNEERALEWFSRAASLGSAEGAFYCAKVAITKRRFDDAHGLLAMAASKEYGPALLWLGLTYIRGLGRPTDLPRGVEYLERSAKTGNYLARRELAVLMMKGRFGLARIPEGVVRFVTCSGAALFLGVFQGQSDKLMG